jgi:phosphatidylserine decarboxylase
LTGRLARVPLPIPLNEKLLRVYGKLFDVNFEEAARAPSEYRTLQDFFTRKLKPGTRPLDADPKSILCPVDGRVMQAGTIEEGKLLQAKGWRFAVSDLLGDAQRAAPFAHGTACTLYLSPADYHRIHMPLTGSVEALQYLPGHLYPVNRFSLNRIRDLFIANERIVLFLTTPAGRAALVLVGATNVGGIRIAVDEIPRARFRNGPFQRSYPGGIGVARGAELGCFELGSTVILLFEQDRVRLTLREGDISRVGRALGFIA